MKYETYIYIYIHICPLSKMQIWVCCHFAATWFNVCLCVSSCNWLKLETTAQLTHAGKVFGTFWGNSYMHLFCQTILLSYRASKKILQWLNKHWNTTCSEYVHAGCVTHVKNTTGLSKASNHTIKSHTNPVKLGVLRVLWQFKNYDPKPLGAQTRGKYSKEKQKDKTLGHMWLSSLADCVLFVVFVGVCWWPTASGSERIPAIYQSYLMKLSPCMWIYEIKWHSGAGSTNY